MSSNKLIRAVGNNYEFAKSFYFEMMYGDGKMPTFDGLDFIDSAKLNFDDVEEDAKEECVITTACLFSEMIETKNHVVEVGVDELAEAIERFRIAMELEKMAFCGLCNIGGEQDEDGWPAISVNEDQYDAIKTLANLVEEKFNDV